MPTVRIHQRTETETVDEAGTLRTVMAVTYSSRLVPPRTVFIPLAEATEERISQAIRDDLAAAETEKPETLEV